MLLAGSGFGLAPPSDDTVSAQFSDRIQPFLRKYCESCHSGADPEAKLDITSIRNVEAIAAAWTTWETMITRIDENEMPPKDASPQPSQEERQAIKAWAWQHRRSEAERQRGDPGPLSTRRLSNAEYNHVIRDLTGYDIRPTQDFPVDPANEAGFDNSGESLTMSPSLVVKYLDAAKVVANHMLLVPDGIRFAPHPVVTDTDRDKYSVQRIVDFYQAQPTAIEDYLWAAWKIQTEIGTQADPIAIERVANDLHLSRKYLHTVWNAIVATESSYGPMGKLRQRWKEVTQITEGERAKEACKSIRQWIQEERSRLQPTFENLKGPGMNGGSQPLVLWKNRQMANHRRSCRLSHPLSETDLPLLAPEDRQAYQDGTSERQRQIVQDYQRFCSIFPDAFYVSERGRAHIDAKESEREGKGRLLSAGFHSMMGYFRDDKPLCELLLDASQLQTLNQLWEELDFISLAPIRQYSGFIWFERAESSFINEETFHFVRAEDRSANSDEMIRRFADAYIEKLRRKEAAPTVIEAVDFHFRDMQRQIRGLEAKLRSAEEAQLRSLLAFAEEAFRVPLDPQGRKGIEDFYARSRQLPGADHRSAMEDTLTSILMSPSFLYRWDLQSTSGSVQSLSDIELASRLSFFVWASGPDKPLLERAQRFDLHSDEAILQEARRMLRDSRRKGMLVEFLGNWLDFRRFDQHNGVDRDLFASFDDALRDSMWKEPVEYVSEIMDRNGGLRELLLSDHVVVDRNLAKHYALPWSDDATGTWRRIDGVQEHQRGGLAPMAIF